MQELMFLAQVFLRNLHQAELFRTARKGRLKKYARDDVKRNHLGKNRRETRAERARDR